MGPWRVCMSVADDSGAYEWGHPPGVVRLGTLFYRAGGVGRLSGGDAVGDDSSGEGRAVGGLSEGAGGADRYDDADHGD